MDNATRVGNSKGATAIATQIMAPSAARRDNRTHSTSARLLSPATLWQPLPSTASSKAAMGAARRPAMATITAITSRWLPYRRDGSMVEAGAITTSKLVLMVSMFCPGW